MADIRILYVEDEPYLAKIVRETLERRGFLVKHLSSGTEALEEFKLWEPDICILDVMLPGKDGFTIGGEIRKTNAKTPIIFLTAKDQTKDLLKGFSSGGNDYIRKPFSMEELMARIDNLLNIAAHKNLVSNIKDLYSIGKLSFDSVKMELVTPSGKIQLSHRESEILKMLCQQLNGVTERKEILMNIWGDDSFFNSRNLDVYIRKIRKYLGRDKDVQLITLKGIGYRLIG